MGKMKPGWLGGSPIPTTEIETTTQARSRGRAKRTTAGHSTSMPTGRSPRFQHHLEGLALELTDDSADLPQQEGPRVDEVDSIHHDGDDAVPALEASGQAVFDEEGVAEHKAMLLITKEDGAFTTRAYLGGSHKNFRESPDFYLKPLGPLFPVWWC